MSKHLFCPYCGSEELNSNYNYDTANLEYECEFCGEEFTDMQLVYWEDCDEQIMFDDIVNYQGEILCPECYEHRTK